jgi:hypothetical protein
MSSHLSRGRWFAFASVLLVSVGLGFTGAKILANETVGYLAGYTWFGLMLIGVPLVLSLLVIGAILSFIPRTRWPGALAIIAATLIMASSFASFKILDAFGQVLYKHEQMVPIGPDAKHELVIFFKPGTTHDQIERFWAEVLSYPTQGGHWTRPGISGILRLFPIQGYEAVGVTFFPNATQAQREEIKSKVHASPIVYKVMEDMVPQNIKKVD